MHALKRYVLKDYDFKFFFLFKQKNRLLVVLHDVLMNTAFCNYITHHFITTLEQACI